MVDLPALTLEELEALGTTVLPSDFFAVGKGRVNTDHTPDAVIEEAGHLTAEHAASVQAWIAAGRPTLGQGRDNQITDLKAVRFTHHRLAQLLAGGMKEIQAGRLCNYSPNRIDQLKHDPAFMELIAHYKATVDEEFVDFVKVASALSMDVAGRLQEMLDQTPEKFTPALAIEALKVIAPLGGHAPISKSINLNVNADLADRLASARRRVQSNRGDGDALDS